MIIIGAGRVGGALAERANQAGAPCTLVTRTEGWDLIAKVDDPIFVAVRNDDLAPVLEKVPPRQQHRLVFTQNGMLRPWLAGRELANASRGLLFFAVARRGAPLEPGGDSLFTGPHADEVVEWLGRLGVPAQRVAAEDFAEVELEKLLWNCTMGLLCEHTGEPVGRVVDRHAPVLSALVDELLEVGMPSFGLSLDRAAQLRLKERLSAYSRSIPNYRAAVKEWPWRNGFFVNEAPSAGLHHELLTKTGHLPR